MLTKPISGRSYCWRRFSIVHLGFSQGSPQSMHLPFSVTICLQGSSAGIGYLRGYTLLHLGFLTRQTLADDPVLRPLAARAMSRLAIEDVGFQNAILDC